MGLRNKIFVYAGVSLIALMSLLTWLSAETNRQANDMVYRERLALVQDIALGADGIIERLSAEVANTTLALRQGWQNELSDANKELLISVKNRLEQYLESSRRPELAVFVTVLDAKGKILWMEPYLPQKLGQSLADIVPVQEVMTGRPLSIGTEGAVINQDGPVLSLVAPVKDSSGIAQGILIADIPILHDNKSLSAFLQRQAGGYDLELVTDSGLILASSSSEPIFKYSLHWDSVRLLAQERLPGIVKHKHLGLPGHMVAYAPLARVPWGIILSRPEEETLALPWIGGRAFLVTGLVVFLAVGLMWLITRQIVTPLEHLSATAQKFGSGDLEAPISVGGNDEIGNLAESLDTMRWQLKHSLDEIGEWNRELEQRVKERTSELEELDRQLLEQNKERGDLLGKIITTQEEERQRIARELHDEVGQSITSLMIGFRVLETQDPEKMRQGITELKRLLAQTLDEVRHLALELRPSSLDDLGLIPALQQYTREYADKFGVNADFQASGFESKRLRPEVEIALYRIIQEALTNVVRHAEAKKVSVLMGIRNSSIVAIVEDNGKGFDVQDVLASKTIEQKLGLYGMQERASLIGGMLTIEATPGKGTTVFVEVPLKGVEISEQDTSANS